MLKKKKKKKKKKRPEPLASCGYGIWRGLRVRISHSDDQESTTISDNVPANPEDVPAISDDVQVEDFQVLFGELGVEIEPGDIVSWLGNDFQ